MVSIKVPINHDEKGDGDPEIGNHFGPFSGHHVGGYPLPGLSSREVHGRSAIIHGDDLKK